MVHIQLSFVSLVTSVWLYTKRSPRSLPRYTHDSPIAFMWLHHGLLVACSPSSPAVRLHTMPRLSITFVNWVLQLLNTTWLIFLTAYFNSTHLPHPRRASPQLNFLTPSVLHLNSLSSPPACFNSSHLPHLQRALTHLTFLTYSVL